MSYNRKKWSIKIISKFSAFIILSLTLSSLMPGSFIFGQSSVKEKKELGYALTPVPFTNVQVFDQFWSRRLETNRKVTIPHCLHQCEITGRIENFEIAAKMKTGKFKTQYPFDDSDVYKTLEAVGYVLMRARDPELEKKADEIIAKIAAAQEPDGYLYTARTIDPVNPPVPWVGPERWSNLYMSHELYNVGHLYEAAVAYYLATGKRNLLEVALKNAELLLSVFGPGKNRSVPGHQEVEIGLVKLYLLTKDKRYLDLAKFYLDERGRADGHKLYGTYSQDHMPVVDQTEAVGHAVRAQYMYIAMADVAAYTGETAYLKALEAIWKDVIGGKVYLTGGIGAAGGIEGFGPAYFLPNATAYCETCASIAHILWNHRLFLHYGEARYIDALERTLYNAFLSGVSLSGNLFFYPNPLESSGQHQRSPWFSCACCPPNVARLIPQIPGLIYSLGKDNSLLVNLFVASSTEVTFGDTKVMIRQETNYPWEGQVKILILPAEETNFILKIRVPGWALGRPVPSDLYNYLNPEKTQITFKLNGQKTNPELDKGYAVFKRSWKIGDTVEIEFPMPIRRVVSHPAVKANEGKVALERGPIVYCAEWVDNGGAVSHLVLDDQGPLTSDFRADLLGGLTIIKGEATALREGEKEGEIIKEKQPFVAIPYYAWAHRGNGEMAVWLAREEKKARPWPKPTIASRSKVTASNNRPARGVNDQWEPEASNDRSRPYLHWWPRKGTLEWVQYDFEKPETISLVEVYWFDDTGEGECRVPASWRVLYREKDQWKPVENLTPYSVAKNTYCRVEFKPVTTTGLRLEIQAQKDFAAGVLEWKVR
ncbi:MAG: glycoside hydrolase family 127 protein [Candidatus Aminicenantes bacterium]|nr:glycoside hydrolase family 127 protein [Candidatus Aminicenantes bacterium]